MKFNPLSLTGWFAFMLAAPVTVSLSEAGCPCNKGGGAAASTGVSPVPMVPYSEPSAPWGMAETGVPGPFYGAGEAVPNFTGANSVGPGYSAATATTWQPPPGSIGQTYQIKSRPVPVKMHPRAAIVDVRVPNAKSVRVHDMNVYRTQDFLEGFQDDQEPTMWHFTSEPLIPGIPHIYRIEARFVDADGKERMEERFVRLIMGRVIEITF